MQLLISPDGAAKCIYSEEIDLTALGSVSIARASHVEPAPYQGWIADLSPIGGPVLCGFHTRSQALAAEQAWLERHWLR
jgi:hypothetical protein